MTNANLEPRTQPRQARSRATVERILLASGELLEEVGVDGFNTNLLANRTGLAVRAIYRYFPNKWAILVALAERMRELERLWVGTLEDYLELPDWKAGFGMAIDRYVEAARVQPAYAALRAASQASPELRSLEAQGSREFQEALAQSLRGVGVSLDEGRLRAVCLVIIESAGRVLDIAVRSPSDEAELLLGELKRMLLNLLQDYIPEEA